MEEIFDFETTTISRNNHINDGGPMNLNSFTHLVNDDLNHFEHTGNNNDDDFKSLENSDKIIEYLNNGELNDEELYDKYIPTDNSLVNEYLKNLKLEEKENEESGASDINMKSKHFVQSEHDYEKIRFCKSIIGIFVPPENFAVVCKGIYRSSFPRIENFEYLKTLKLKSILCLIPEEYPIENIKFNELNKITVHQIGLNGNKEPFVKIKPELVTQALKILVNPENHPILIHCNRGKHRTGCVVGCIRKLQNWSYSMIFDEYRRFAYPKERPLDQQFIEMFDSQEVEEYASKALLLPMKW